MIPARQQRITSNATAVQAGIETLTTDEASIVVFINQSTAKADQQPSLTASSVRTGMVKVNGTWLIEKFDPV